jgi:hypothetical protein
MRGTSILNIKAWSKISNIHAPLPRTPRESQQLLNALTSSFRRNLEAADGHLSKESTDKHLQTILDNPLFRIVPSKPTYRPSNADGKDARVSRIATQPMAVFDDLVASGTITGGDVAECLDHQLALIGSGSVDAAEAMKKTGAGARVVAWFWASDSASRKTLFRFHNATKATLKFMAAEGLHDTVMIWLRMISKSDLGGLDGHIPERSGRRLFSAVLRQFLIYDLRYGRGIESALTFFVRAAQICSFLKKPSSPELNDEMLRRSGAALTRWIVDHAMDEAKEISPSLYNRFCEVLTTVPSLPFMAASVWIYHPATPTAEYLLRYHESHPQRFTTEVSRSKRDYLVRVYLDGVRLFLDQEKDDDASSLALRIKALMSAERGLIETSKRSSPSSEYENLDLQRLLSPT